METGEKLKLYRKANNYTQVTLAQIIGTDRSTIASYENGRRHISYNRAKQFAHIFRIKPEDILNSEKQEGYSFYANNLSKKSYQTFISIYNNLNNKK